MRLLHGSWCGSGESTASHVLPPWLALLLVRPQRNMDRGGDNIYNGEMNKTRESAGHAGGGGSAKEDASYFGRMNGPTASSILRGPCGDEMEFYLYIRDDILEDVTYYTEGCDHTKACALAVAKRAKGKSVMEALAIAPRDIIDSGECVPEEGRHCAILAVSALYRAIADYLLRP